MKKNNRIFVGDIIITRSNFTPKDKNKQTIETYDELYRGIIVVRHGEYYGVRFGQGLEFTNYLNGLLGKPVGCYLKREDFEVIKDC